MLPLPYKSRDCIQITKCSVSVLNKGSRVYGFCKSLLLERERKEALYSNHEPWGSGAFLDILGPGGTVPFGAPFMGWEVSKASQSSLGGGGGCCCKPPPLPGGNF